MNAITLDLIKVGIGVIAACLGAFTGGWALARSRDRRPFDEPDKPAEPAARPIHAGAHRRTPVAVPATTDTMPVLPTVHAPPWDHAAVPAGQAPSMLAAPVVPPPWHGSPLRQLPGRPPVHHRPARPAAPAPRPAAPSPAAGPVRAADPASTLAAAALRAAAPPAWTLPRPAPSPEPARPQLPDYVVAALGGRTVDEVVDSAFSRAMAMDVAELIRGGAL